MKNRNIILFLIFVLSFIVSSCGGRTGFYEVYDPDNTGNETCNGIYVYDDNTWEASGTSVIPFSGGQRYHYHYTGIVTQEGVLKVTGGENIVTYDRNGFDYDVRRSAPFQFEGSEIIGSGMRFKKTNKTVK